MILSSHPVQAGIINAPDVPWLRPNTLHVRIDALDLEVVGVRVPAYEGKERPLKRDAWNWIIDASLLLATKRAIITGDLNTAIGDPEHYSGDQIKYLASGWKHAETPCTFVTLNGHERTIDHAFMSPAMHLKTARCNWPSAASSELNGKGAGVPDHAMLVIEFQ